MVQVLLIALHALRGGRVHLPMIQAVVINVPWEPIPLDYSSTAPDVPVEATVQTLGGYGSIIEF